MARGPFRILRPLPLEAVGSCCGWPLVLTALCLMTRNSDAGDLPHPKRRGSARPGRGELLAPIAKHRRDPRLATAGRLPAGGTSPGPVAGARSPGEVARVTLAVSEEPEPNGAGVPSAQRLPAGRIDRLLERAHLASWHDVT